MEKLRYIRINIMKSFFKSVLSCTRLSLQYPKMRRKIYSNLSARLFAREKSRYKNRCFTAQIHSIKLRHSCFMRNKIVKQEKYPLKSCMIQPESKKSHLFVNYNHTNNEGQLRKPPDLTG